MPKIQPFKILGKAIGQAVGSLPIVGQVKNALDAAKQDAANRRAGGEAPAQAYLNAASDQVRTPLSAPQDKTILMYVLLGVGAVVLIMLLKRR